MTIFSKIAAQRLGIAMLLATSACQSPAVAQADSGRGVVVKFKSTYGMHTLSGGPFDKVLSKFGHLDSVDLGCGGSALVTFKSPIADVTTFKETLAALNTSSSIFEYVVPTQRVRILEGAVLESDKPPPDAPAELDWNLSRVSAQAAWEKVPDASSVLVAVVDNGIFYEHPNLKANIWLNKGEFGKTPSHDDDGNGVDDDIHGAVFLGAKPKGDPNETTSSHGTPVAGVLGATGDHNSKMKGIAPNVKILAVKFMEKNEGEVTDAIRGMAYALRNGAEILNLSWGTDVDYPPLKSCLDEIANSEKTQKVLIVAAAGNLGENIRTQTPHFPASYTFANMIVVTSSIRPQTATGEDQLGGRANRDRYLVNIAAPGYDIYSTSVRIADPASPSIPATPDYMEPLWGTTFAAPHVSGAAALLKAMHPDWTGAQLKAHLLASVDKMSGWTQDISSSGRLNVKRAVYGPLTNVTSDGGTDWKVGSARTVRWKNSYNTPVCKLVDVLWSIDGGKNFPVTLAKGIDNTHQTSANITVPASLTMQGVVRAQCQQTKFVYDLKGINTAP